MSSREISGIDEYRRCAHPQQHAKDGASERARLREQVGSPQVVERCHERRFRPQPSQCDGKQSHGTAHVKGGGLVLEMHYVGVGLGYAPGCFANRAKTPAVNLD